MQALDYLLPQPPFDLTPEKQSAFETLFASTPLGSFVEYRLPYPKWQFLSSICKSRNLVMHGSQYTDIGIIEPRKAIDIKAFSNHEAIYATTDGIWVIFFAIVDRRNFGPLSLFNTCLDIRVSPEQTLGPLYFFSVTHSALPQKPWCDGVVYILPRENFEQEPAQTIYGSEIIFPHWIGSKPTKPLAKLRVQAQDFPFLYEIHGHDDETLTQLALADPNGFPWPQAIVT